MCRIGVLILMCFLCLSEVFAQKGMKEVKEYDYDFSKVIPVKYLSLHHIFDSTGLLLEEIEYLSNGMTARHRKCAYDSTGTMLYEVFLDGQKKPYRTIRYIYSNGLKTQRLTFNKDSVLIDKKEFEYIKY